MEPDIYEMNNNIKIFFGKILGEILRIQKYSKNMEHSVNDATIYGLLNGIEPIIDQVLESVGFISTDKFNTVVDILDSYWNKNNLDTFKGYYTIQDELKKYGITRGEAITIIKYLYANDQFTSLIEKMDSSHSPTECRNFKLNKWDV